MDHGRRQWLIDSIINQCSIEHVADAIAAFARPGTDVYVEQRGSGYRWSPAHAGGSYPLLRTVAVTIDVEYHSLILPFVTFDGRAIVNADAPADGEVVAASFIEATADTRENRERIEAALGSNTRSCQTPAVPLDH